MLGQRKPHDLPLTLVNAINDVVAGAEPADHPEIMHHHEGSDFVPGEPQPIRLRGGAGERDEPGNGVASVCGQRKAEDMLEPANIVQSIE